MPSPVTYRLIASPTFAALVVELMVTAFVKVSEFGTMVRVGKRGRNNEPHIRQAGSAGRNTAAAGVNVTAAVSVFTARPVTVYMQSHLGR